ncbi:alpha/beta fold hydrolase [Cryobacterium algoricola]|nr:alpha/beta hydrolase [Cryobacterium algoricola]
MPDSAPTITTHTIATDTIPAVEVTIRERGHGRIILLLHGGGGPLTVARFADLLAERKPARVLTPTHPGFGGTVQPDTVGSIRALAELYVALLEDLDVHDVTVVGNSIGGWVAAEMAILNNPRISGIVLVDAVGIDVPGHPVADFFALTFPQIAQLSYYHPAAFQIDPSTLTPAQQALMAGNRAALARYVGTESMSDPTLATRLGEITTPALAVWGAADRIVDTEYGRAFARAMPTATFSVIEKSGHLPQLESPDELLAHLWDFATRTR